MAARATSVPLENVKDDPDCNYYKESGWFRIFILYLLCITVVSSIAIVLIVASADVRPIELLIDQAISWSLVLVSIFLSLIGFVLFSFTIGAVEVKRQSRLSPNTWRTLTIGLRSLNLGFWLATQLVVIDAFYDWSLLSAAALYLLLAVLCWLAP